MRKILLVAQREFIATAGTRAFIVGILVTPIVIGVLILLVPWFAREDPPAIAGSVAVVDPTGQVAPGLATYLEPARIEQRRQDAYRRIQEAMPSALRSAGGRQALRMPSPRKTALMASELRRPMEGNSRCTLGSKKEWALPFESMKRWLR